MTKQEAVASVPTLDLHHRPLLPQRTDYGIAVIGGEGVVNYAHLPAYRVHGLHVIGCYDINREAAQSIAERSAIPRVYESLDALLHDPEVDICDIAVPAWYQCAIAEQIAAAGKHILCQKPLAENLVDAEAIVAAACCANRNIAVNRQMCWSPVIAAAHDLIWCRFIGQPTDIQILVSIATLWHMWSWLQVLPFLDLMYRSIYDSVCCLLGDPAWITSRHARYLEQQERAETKTMTILDYESRLQVLVSVNHDDHSGDNYATFRFSGTEGMIEGIIGLRYDYPNGRSDSLQCCSVTVMPDIWFDVHLEGRWIPGAFIGPIASLIEAIHTDDTPLTDAAAHLNTLRLVRAAYRSAAKQRSAYVLKL